MALPVKLIAAVTTAIAGASAAAYITITSQNADVSRGGGVAPSPAGQPAPAGPADPGSGPEDVVLCVGPDRILHTNREGEEQCPSGEEQLALTWDEDQQLCDLCDPLKDPPAPEPESDNAALDAIERRIAALENSNYFEVVNEKTGLPIFTVRPGGARVYNTNGQAVAAFGTTQDGGHFTAHSTTGGAAAAIGAAGKEAEVLIFENALVRAELGTSGGPYAFRLPSGNGLIAGLGQSRLGTGAVIVGTLPGVTQGSMTVTDGRGMVSVSYNGGAGGLAFAEATIGGGLLDIANGQGDSAVKMGHNGHRYGIVLTGPVPGFPYVPRSGLPGSYFMGCAGGERPACTPSVP